MQRTDGSAPIEQPDHETSARLIERTSDIVAAHVRHNRVAVDEVSALIDAVHRALAGLGTDGPPPATRAEPAVAIRSSVRKDYLVCLDCGRKMKTLKRHLMSEHGLTVDAYRARWNLKADYPVTASDYAAARRAVALKSGLGRIPGQKRGGRKKDG